MPISADIYNAFAPKVESPQEVTNGLARQAMAGQAVQAGQLELQQRQAALANAPALAAQAQAKFQSEQDHRAAQTAQANAAAGHSNAQSKKLTIESATAAAQELAQGMRGIDPNDNGQVAALYARAHELGMPMESIDAEMKLIPKSGTPERLAWHAKQVGMGQSLADELRQKLEAKKAEEAARHNLSTEKTAQGQLGVAQGHLAVSRAEEGRAASAPKGQIVQTDNGPMLVDPRNPSSAQPITTPDGQAIKPPAPKLREIPAAANKSIIENQQNLSRVDTALAALAKNPGAVGPLNMLPGSSVVRQYTDPEGVNARAGVADLGSMVIHDRSGAAVSVSEFPRLAPFIPSVNDAPETAKKKLENFRRVYAQEADLLGQTYSAEQGYRPNPALASKPAARTVKRTGTDANGKRVVEYSDGAIEHAN